MSRYIGNYLRVPSSEPQQASAPGIWSLSEQLNYQRANLWPPARDPSYNQTVLHLSGDVVATRETNPVTQPYSFLSDASTNNFVVSPNGDVSARPFNPYLNNYSNYFPSASSYFTPPSSAIPTGAGTAFTIEAWVYPSASASTFTLIGIGSAGNFIDLYVNTNNQLVFDIKGTVNVLASPNNTVKANQWQHVVLTRTAGNLYTLYVNGTSVGTPAVNSTSLSSSSSYQLCAGNGYVSNLRVTTGAVVYSGSFTPPTSPLSATVAAGTVLLLTCQSNRFRDAGPSNLTLTINGSPAVSQNSPFVSYDTTNGSGYFDGTGDYLSGPTNTASSFNLTGDFTIECWAYFTSASTAGQGLVTWADSGGWNGWQFINDAGTIKFEFLAAASAAATVTGGTVINNQWYHLAAVRNGSGSNNVVIYINGSSSGSPTTYTGTQGTSASSFFRVGVDRTATNEIVGYISGARVVNGTAVYTATFTPPTAPLTAITNTQLLTLQTRAPATNNGFIDSSPNNFVVTRNGNTTQGSFSPFSPTGWSNYFAGPTNYLSFSSSLFALGTDGFTIEGWIYLTAYSYSAIFSTWLSAFSTNNGIMLGTNSSGNLELNIGNAAGGGSQNAISASVIPLNTWVFIQGTKAAGSGGALKIYINGNDVTPSTITTTRSVNLTSGVVGRYYVDSSNHGINGYISNVRVSNTVRSSTVPTAPFAVDANTVFLSCQANRFKDGGPGNVSLTVNGSPSVQAFSPFAPAQSYTPSQTGGSGYFDGTTDYLTIANSNDFDTNTPFTLECWVYTGSTGCMLGRGGGAASWSTTDGHQFIFYITGGVLRWQFNSGGSPVNLDSSAIPLNSWVYCVVGYNGTTTRVWLNGVSAATSTSSYTLPTTRNIIRSGLTASGDQPYLGYISGLRFVKSDVYGVANTTITVPTAPPTAIPNTSLLLNFTNGGIVDATGKNNLETVANSGVQTSQAKWSPGSMYFDGTTDYLKAPTSELWNLGSGDFAVEFFIRFNSIGAASNAIVGKWGSGAGTYAWIVQINSSQITFYTGNSGTLGTQLTFAWSPSTNVWYHVAIARTSGNVRAYVDGTQVGTTQANSHTLSSTAGLCAVGENLDGGGQSQFINGYLDDLRITRGYNRGYSGSTITVPTGPFPLA